MQVDKQPCPVNIVELRNKKVFLVRPDMADRDKGKNIIVGSPHTSNIPQGVVTEKAPGRRRTTKSEGIGGGGGGPRGPPADQNSLSHALWTVRHLCTDSLGPTWTVQLAQPDGPTSARGHDFHTLSSITKQKQARGG
jgi:hypothetical protein